MASDKGKVSRRLTLKLEPLRGKKLSISVSDATTRSEEGKRHVEAELTADTWTEEAAVEAFEKILGGFIKSCRSEDPGELFAEETSAKPTLDKG